MTAHLAHKHRTQCALRLRAKIYSIIMAKTVSGVRVPDTKPVQFPVPRGCSALRVHLSLVQATGSLSLGLDFHKLKLANTLRSASQLWMKYEVMD